MTVIGYTLSGPTVFIIDDHKVVRDALGEMLSVFGFTVETYDSADTFLGGIHGSRLGCIVADVRMPGTSGIQLVQELARRQIQIPVVLMSGHADVPMAVASMKAGAEDFIEKPVDDTQLIAAINRAVARTFTKQIQQHSLDQLSSQFGRLTPREVEIFDMVAQGYTSQAIAAKLGIGTRTVDSYRSQVLEKMETDNVSVLVRQAVRLGRITP